MVISSDGASGSSSSCFGKPLFTNVAFQDSGCPDQIPGGGLRCVRNPFRHGGRVFAGHLAKVFVGNHSLCHHDLDSVQGLVVHNCSYSCSFSRHAKTHASMVLVIWLNENVHIHARFLAMPKLMQAWFWSFGLTKTFIFMLVFSPCQNSCKHGFGHLA